MTKRARTGKGRRQRDTWPAETRGPKHERKVYGTEQSQWNITIYQKGKTMWPPKHRSVQKTKVNHHKKKNKKSRKTRGASRHVAHKKKLHNNRNENENLKKLNAAYSAKGL